MTLALTATLLITTNTWDLRPQLASWWAKFLVRSDPEPKWNARLGGVPDLVAVMATGQVVVSTRGFVEAYREDSGRLIWHYGTHFALPAGDVVVLRRRPQNPDEDRGRYTGYSVVEPASGAVLWGDRDAIAVWAFSDKIVDLICPENGDCHVRARSHRDNGTVLWSAPVPGGARTISGPNPSLVGTRDPAEWFATAAAGTPGRLPPVIGLTVEGRVQVIDTVDGVRVREVTPPNRETRVALSGERLLFSHSERDDSGCRFRIEAFDYRSDTSVWRKDGFDLDTASGAGCEQRRDPLGAGNHLVALRDDNLPTLLAAATGEPTWTGVPGERVLATDGELAVVEGADRRTVRVIDLLDPDRRAVWSEEVGLKSEAAVTRDYVVIRAGDAGRLIVINHFPAQNGGVAKLVDRQTKATVVGYGVRGLIIASGRRIGYIPIGG